MLLTTNSQKKFYRIGDVSQILNLPQSTIRFWEKEFSELRPRRNSGGTRMYTPHDIEQLRIIRFLIKDKGLHSTVPGNIYAGTEPTSNAKHEVIKRLQAMRRRLTDLLEALDQRQRD